MARTIRFVDVDVRGFDRQAAARRHRVARVDRQVEDDLFELAGVGPDARQRRRERRRELDVFANQPPQHVAHVGDQRIQIDDRRLHHLLAAECEQLSGQAGSALGRLHDLRNLVAHGFRQIRLLLEQVRIAQHGCQQVVEVVRHAPGELADRLHLLRLPELLLELLLVADVDADAEQFRRPVVFEQHARAAGVPVQTAVGPDRAELDRQLRSLDARLLERVFDRPAIVWMNEREEFAVRRRRLLGRQAEERRERVGPGDAARTEIDFPDAHPRRRQRELRAFLGLAEGHRVALGGVV